MTLSTRIGVMNSGRIIQVGEPAAIYEYPGSRFVADFIGSVNLFEGNVTFDETDHIRIGSPDLGSEIYVGHGVSCTLGQPVCFAIRPEKLRLSRTRPDLENAFEALVEDVAYMGNLSIYRLKLASGRVVKATKSNLTRQDEDQISWDESVWVSWEENAGVVLTQ